MPRLPDCRIVGKELTFVFPSNGDALVGFRMIRDAVDAAEKAVAAATPKPSLTFRVGGKYKNRKGRVWTVKKIDREGPYPILAYGINDTLHSFTAGGQYFDWEISDLDLIEEVMPCPTIHDCRAGQTERCTCCDKEG